MSDRKALIIMARSPIEGRVKTRLAASVGVHTAFGIYRELLSHTVQLAKSVSADVLFFWTENSGVNEVSFGQHFIQTGDDLGMKMKNAFDVIFTMGYNRVVMIGTDCIDLFPARIEEGLCALQRADVVFGPAHDGGYYLLGMKNTQSELFDDMPWSTDKLLARSIIQCRESMLSFVLLPQLSDIDTLEDVQRSKLADRLTAG